MIQARLALVLVVVHALACGGEPAGPVAAPKSAEPAATAPAAAAAAPTESAAGAAIGAPAPDFSLADVDGVTHTLAEHRGKVVVLEWFNPECPFVNHAHTAGELKSMAGKMIPEGIVWLAINSSAPGKQGHGVEANRAGAAKFGLGHPILLDESGEVGRRYGAVKTPHMFVIDGAGALVYRGAIDNAPMGEIRDGAPTVRNHVADALSDLAAGRPVASAETAAYGCSVKYAK